jgi:hypothetical protein
VTFKASKPVDHSKIIAAIEVKSGPASLRQLMKNVAAQGVTAVHAAAFRRLVEILPEEEPGTVEHDFWRTIFAFEQLLRKERGKTVLLSRTRQKLKRVGVMQTLNDFATATATTQGFDMLIARSLPELTGEAVILRHEDKFEPEVVAAASARLAAAGVDVAALLTG